MKKTFRFFTLAAVLAFVFVPMSAAFAQGPGPDSGQVVFGSNFTLESGDTFEGDLVVFGGNVTVEEDAKLNGNLVVFGGTVTSNGSVHGDLVIIGGQVELENQALVTGDVVTVGGQLTRSEGATIEGDVVNNIQPKINVPNGQIPEIPNVTVPDVINVGFNPFWEFGKVVGTALVIAFLGMLVTLFFQDQLGRVSQAVVSQPLMTSSIGLLTIVALILLGITIILLPFALLGLIPLGFAWLFGVVAIGQEIGSRFAKAVKLDWAPVLTTSVGTFVLVFVVSSVQSLNGLLPLMACATWILPAVVGLLAIGAVVITRFGTRPIQSHAMSIPAPSTNAGQAPPPPALS